MLEIRNLVVGYGVNPALQVPELSAGEGQITAIIGANGAGKTTLLRAISGFLKPREGEIRFLDKSIGGLSASQIVRAGIAQVPEGRQLFHRMSVYENLQMGAFVRNDKKGVQKDLTRVFEYFPILREKAALPARSLSGGQQQMLAFGRSLMSRPRMLLLDEPSVGLAPAIEHQLIETVRRIATEENMGVILVEQNANLALSVSKVGYVLELGRPVLTGPAREIANNPMVKKAYLGM